MIPLLKPPSFQFEGFFSWQFGPLDATQILSNLLKHRNLKATTTVTFGGDI